MVRNRSKIMRTVAASLLLDQQLAVLQPIAERDITTHPHALLARRGELVPDALADHLALELGEGQQDVQRQPAHRGRGAEGLGHRDEGDVVGVEHLDQLREIHERARQPVDLVDDHDIDQACLDVAQQPLQCRPFQRGAGDAAIIIAVGHQHPSLGPLACHVSLTGLPLGIEGVELHVEPLLGGFARVDGAAEFADDRLCWQEPTVHCALPRWFLSPKNIQPFQRVPVMARATAESDL